MSGVGPKLLSRLLDEHGPALELLARQWCRSPADVVQDAFVQLARQSVLPENVAGWLYRVVRNGAISQSRSAQRRRQHEAAAGQLQPSWFTPTPADLVDADAASEELSRLPIEEREVIVAHLWGRLSFNQIALLIDTSSSTAHRRYQSGLEKLRETLGVACLKKKFPTKS